MRQLHPIQAKILDLSKKEDISKLSLRQLGKRIGVDDAPQKIKHHLAQLYKLKYLKVQDKSINIFDTIKASVQSSVSFLEIPIVGKANCGKATLIANEEIMGYLKVSSSLIKNRSNELIAVIAEGDSMNAADIGGKSISEGDYVVVDTQAKNVKNGDYVLSIINGCANIKQLYYNHPNETILLKSRSKVSGYDPIVISSDEDYLVNGKVVQVIKNSQT